MRTKRDAYREHLQGKHDEIADLSRTFLQTADASVEEDVAAIAACGVLLRHLAIRIKRLAPVEKEIA